MHILLTDDLPLESPAGSSRILRLAEGLRRAGHAVTCLLADRGTPEGAAEGAGAVSIRRVVLRRGDPAADLPFDPPCFQAEPGSRPTFVQLSDAQIADYREAFRRRLDESVVELDPHVIHAQHVWLQGHLALETGVPYVLTAQGPELAAYQADARYRRFAEEAVAGAARILAAGEAVYRQVRATFSHLDDRLVLLPAIDDAPDHGSSQLTAIYQAALDERFGR